MFEFYNKQWNAYENTTIITGIIHIDEKQKSEFEKLFEKLLANCK